jgi:predicted NBD/HSP70 family sugar kinase
MHKDSWQTAERTVYFKEVLASAGRSIGIALANLMNVLNPSLIMLDGSSVRAGALLLEPMRDSIAAYSLFFGKQREMAHWLRLALFYDAEREMGCSWCLKRSYALQLDRLRSEVIEEAHTFTQEHMGNVHMEFVEQTRLQGLLD